MMIPAEESPVSRGRAGGGGSSGRGRDRWRDVTGVLVLDKPTGMSSNGALQAVRRLFRARKAGHTGSLDPLASGVLPICFGEATKLSGWLLESRKTYEVAARLGERTDTADSTGIVIEVHDVPELEKQGVLDALDGFRGSIEQVPPMYSALKKDGRRLYEMARKGQTIERPPRRITIHAIELLSIRRADISFRVCCSKGTYVRTLVEDVAAALGTVGHVTALRRTASGPFDIESAVTLEQLQVDSLASAAGLDDRLLPADTAVPDLPAVFLESRQVEKMRCGQRIAHVGDGVPGPVKLYGPDGEMVGIGEAEADWLAPRRMFVTADTEGR
jgi:tRNA pseudouridine55 synthase